MMKLRWNRAYQSLAHTRHVVGDIRIAQNRELLFCFRSGLPSELYIVGYFVFVAVILDSCLRQGRERHRKECECHQPRERSSYAAIISCNHLFRPPEFFRQSFTVSARSPKAKAANPGKGIAAHLTYDGFSPPCKTSSIRNAVYQNSQGRGR